MSDPSAPQVPDDAIEAAAKVLCRRGTACINADAHLEHARAILAAALPSLRRHIINEAIREGRVAPIAG